ncbi:MAG: erythromycin esterase family protein [Stackebrandtia sp.]
MNQAIDTEAVRQWVADNAKPLPPAGSPQILGAVIGDAVVTGLGETTRQAHEVVVVAHHMMRYLVEHKGYRALALADDSSVVAELDDYVRNGSGTAAGLVANMWAPWRTTETVDVIEWIRSYNRQHADDPVRLLGLGPVAIRVDDYDKVVEHVRGAAPRQAAELEERYDTIRTAHDLGEHVQRSRGIHPGRPFVELAREAYELVATLGGTPADERVKDIAERIVEFHDNTVAANYDFQATATAMATSIVDYHLATGRKVVFWEGIAHTAAATALSNIMFAEPLHTTGGRLRERLGDGYASVVIGFDHGRIHDGVEIPMPPRDFSDAVLGGAEPDVYLLDLRAERPEAVGHWLRGDHKLRVIAGIYDPGQDARHYVAGGPLDEWFNAVVRVREITETTMLG